MKKSITFALIAVGWMILFNCIILNFLINKESLSTNNLITGATTKNIISAEGIGRITVPLIMLNTLMVALLVIGYSKIKFKNNKIKFEF